MMELLDPFENTLFLFPSRFSFFIFFLIYNITPSDRYDITIFRMNVLMIRPFKLMAKLKKKKKKFCLFLFFQL